jgi:predicted nucleic acid-binding protein
MAKAVLVDTGFVVALLDPLDGLNGRALNVAQGLAVKAVPLVTTDAVVLEIANYFSRGPLRAECLAWLDVIRASPGWEVLPLDRPLLRRGEARYRRFSDKTWSLTDCISMEIMIERRLRDVAAYDVHFEQAGFRSLLR